MTKKLKEQRRITRKVLKHLEKTPLKWIGFCSFVAFEMVDSGMLSKKEYDLFSEFIYYHRPKKTRNEIYFFAPYKRQPRINFLKKLLEQTKGGK